MIHITQMEVVGMHGDHHADAAFKMGRTMPRFRPIAPKPLLPGGNGINVAAPLDAKPAGTKRKGGRRGRKGPAAKKACAGSPAGAPFREQSIIHTLPLMPMTPEHMEAAPETPSPTASSEGHVYAPQPVRPVGSWVTVECVTDTWRDGPAEADLTGRPAPLETDTCPVFVSDADGRVTWTNEAYRRMVVGPGDEEEVRVALQVARGVAVPKEGVTCFTCRVRVRYGGSRRRKGTVSMAAPCDVWRLRDGRLAWRLDLKAALSLSILGCC